MYISSSKNNLILIILFLFFNFRIYIFYVEGRLAPLNSSIILINQY
nr:MAG TPA: hypothetical protein [Ackermannviridae sp.]